MDNVLNTDNWQIFKMQMYNVKNWFEPLALVFKANIRRPKVHVIALDIIITNSNNTTKAVELAHSLTFQGLGDSYLSPKWYIGY